MKPIVTDRGPANSIGHRFDERRIWSRRFWNGYYLFELDTLCNVITVYKNMYNPRSWQDEWTEVHRFELRSK